MTQQTPRLGLSVPQGTDQPAGPADLLTLANQLDTITVVKLIGTLASRPNPAVDGRIYETNDSGQPVSLYWDNGSAWITLTQASVVSAKGDLAVGVGPGTLARLGVGTDGQVLVARSTSPDGVDWEGLALAGAVAIKTYTEALVTINPAGGAPTLDLSQANEFALTLSANASLSLANVPATVGTRISAGLTLTQPASGGPYTMSWPASFDWGAAGVPTLSGAGHTDEFGFDTDNNGTTWRAHLVGSGF